MPGLLLEAKDAAVSGAGAALSPEPPAPVLGRGGGLRDVGSRGDFLCLGLPVRWLKGCQEIMRDASAFLPRVVQRLSSVLSQLLWDTVVLSAPTRI